MLKYLIKNYSTRQRILNYFAESHKYEKTSDICNLVKCIQTNSQSLSTVDNEFCKKIPNLSMGNMLFLLNAWSSLETKVLPKTVFYMLFEKKIQRGAWKTASWNHLVQITHFISSLSIKDNKPVMIFLLHAVNDSEELFRSDPRDICVICEAAFRTSTAIASPNIRQRISNICLKELDKFNASWLIMLIKGIIISNYYDIAALKSLAYQLKNSVDTFSPTEQCYLLKLFGNASLREDITTLLAKSFQQKLYTEKKIRIKDVGVFLWTSAFLGLPCDSDFIQQVILPFLEPQWKDLNLREGLNITIAILNSLWILGSAHADLYKKLLTFETINVLKGKKNNYRDISRLASLLDIFFVEFPNCITHYHEELRDEVQHLSPVVPDIRKEISNRFNLPRLASRLHDIGCANIKFEYPVRVYVAGCSCTWRDQILHVDLLDSSTLLIGDDRILNGRMVAKYKYMRMMRPEVSHILVEETMLDSNPDHVTSLIKLGLH